MRDHHCKSIGRTTSFVRSSVRSSVPPRRGAFTLVELLIVIGLIVTILSIAVPAVLIAKQNGLKARMKSDLGLIDTAIAAYKADFGDIPRFADAVSDQTTSSVVGNGTWLDYSTDRGARLLCFALISPGPETSNSSPTYGQDGSNGPGFRVRRNAAGGSGPLQGRVYGPYVQVEKFKLETDKTGQFPNMSDAKMLDVNGNPILYYPALPGVPIIVNSGTYVSLADPSSVGLSTPKPLYNAYDNTQDTTPGFNGRAAAPGQTAGALVSLADMQKLMNCDPGTGALLTGAQGTYTGPYILWTAGLDGRFGLDANGKTDDIANFDFPAQMRR